MQLRPYQRESVDCTWNYLRAQSGNPCIVLPTGSGKTIVLAELIREALATWPGTRICVLAHVRELVSQNHDKLMHYWPEAPAGIYSAGLKRRDRFEPVIFASIQSVAKRAMQMGRFDLLLIDEAHRVPLRSEGQYRQFIADCKRANPQLRIAGLTATPYRLGGGPVCGPDYILNEVAYEARIGDLIRDGYLSRLVSKAGATKADLSNVHIRNGEYLSGELERACNIEEVVEAACDEIVSLCADRKAWLLFAAGVKHAEHVRHALAERGVAVDLVTGKTPAAERDAIIARFQRGELQALVNINVLTEGFDATHIDAVVMLRPTKSAALYYQMVGRGMRLHPGKYDCLILDFSGNIVEHGPVDAIRPPRKPGQKADSEAPVRECPQCHGIVPIQARECPDCGYQWPLSEFFASHDTKASGAAILSEDIKPARWPVKSVSYREHTGKSGTPTLQVTYHCGLRSFREWVCLEHSGFARAKALTWWMARDPQGLAPRTVEAALDVTDRLRVPTFIHVREAGKYPEIVKHEFAEPDTTAAEDAACDAGDGNGDRPQSADRDPMHRLRQFQREQRSVRPVESTRANRSASGGL